MNFAEMSRLAERPREVRALAQSLLRRLPDEEEGQARDFLQQLLRYGEKEGDGLSIRQREYLHALREKTSVRAKADGISADRLIAQAFERRFDLPDDIDEHSDQMWIEAQRARGAAVALRVSEWKRLLRICRMLGVPLPAYVNLDR